MKSFQTYYNHKGSQFGKCHTNPESLWYWVNIPKNASSFTQTLLAHELLWYEHNYHDDNLLDKTAFAILRNPIDRWCSGIAEYITLYHKDFNLALVNKQMLDLIFDKVAFDDHTECQIYFVDGIDHSTTKWFWFDQSYEQKLINWMQSNKLLGDPYEVPAQVRSFMYATKDSLKKQEIKNFFQNVIRHEQKYQNQLCNYFAKDFELINRTQINDL